jgi:hypothetical protein
MGRKSKYINKITKKDEEMLKAFSRVGYLSKDMLQRELLVADRRITNFSRDNYIEKCSFFNKKSKETEEIYRLTSKGQKLMERELNIQSFYRSSSAMHDLRLADKYLSLTTEEKDSWKTESEMRSMYEEIINSMSESSRFEEYQQMMEQHLISAIDASYINTDGVLVGVEITTSSYGNAEINSKEEFSNVLGIQTEYIKT